MFKSSLTCGLLFGGVALLPSLSNSLFPPRPVPGTLSLECLLNAFWLWGPNAILLTPGSIPWLPGSIQPVSSLLGCSGPEGLNSSLLP